MLGIVEHGDVELTRGADRHGGAVGEFVLNAFRAEEILTQQMGAAYHAELLDFLIGSLLLNQAKSFPKPAGLHESVPGIFQHVISGTGHDERAAAPKRP